MFWLEIKIQQQHSSFGTIFWFILLWFGYVLCFSMAFCHKLWLMLMDGLQLKVKLFTSKYPCILVELDVEKVDCVSLYIATDFDYSSTWQKEKETFCSNDTGNTKSQPACLTTNPLTSSIIHNWMSALSSADSWKRPDYCSLEYLKTETSVVVIRRI